MNNNEKKIVKTEIPANCQECSLQLGSYCAVSSDMPYVGDHQTAGTRYEECPLIMVDKLVDLMDEASFDED